MSDERRIAGQAILESDALARKVLDVCNRTNAVTAVTGLYMALTHLEDLLVAMGTYGDTNLDAERVRLACERIGRKYGHAFPMRDSRIGTKEEAFGEPDV